MSLKVCSCCQGVGLCGTLLKGSAQSSRGHLRDTVVVLEPRVYLVIDDCFINTKGDKLFEGCNCFGGYGVSVIH